MKKTISTLVAVLLTAVCLAQVPQKFNYQAIARSSTGEFIKNQVVRIQFSVLDGGASGTEVYKEEHTVNTDANGLISAQVGGGAVQSGDFSKIDWSKGNMWLQTNLDAGSGFELLGAQELLSVPYAIQATYASSFKDEFGNSYKMVVDPTNNSTLSIQSTSVPNKVEVDSVSFSSTVINAYIKENRSLDAKTGSFEIVFQDNSVLIPSYYYYSFFSQVGIISVNHYINEFAATDDPYTIAGCWSTKYASQSATIRITGGNEAGLAPVSDDVVFTFPATTVATAPTNVVVDNDGYVTWTTTNPEVKSKYFYKLDETDAMYKPVNLSSSNPRITEPGTYRLYESDLTFASPYVEFTVP